MRFLSSCLTRPITTAKVARFPGTPGGLLSRSSNIRCQQHYHQPHHRQLWRSSHPPASTDKRIDLDALTQQLGVRLTRHEHEALRLKLGGGGSHLHAGHGISQAQLSLAARQAVEERTSLELCLSVIERSASKWDALGKDIVLGLRFFGTAVLASAGCQVAGEAGMNIIGCSLVGCAAAMGGGTLNNLIYGTCAHLSERPGVFWAKDVRFLAVALSSCVVTFFVWPAYCRETAKHYLRDVIGRERLEADGSVGMTAFCEACRREPAFRQALEMSLPQDDNLKDDEDDDAKIVRLFHAIDTDCSGTVELDELQRTVAASFDNSVVTYAADTVALASLAVFAVHGAVGVALHPLVAAASGVTVCFGGILRDIFCGRSLAIGGQSYALATGCGSSLYVLMREMDLRGLHLPLIARIALSFSTIVAIRAWEWNRGKPLLGPMELETADGNALHEDYGWEKHLLAFSPSAAAWNSNNSKSTSSSPPAAK